MIDDQTIAVLQRQVRRTGRSLLQYTDESFPWTRGKDAEILPKLHDMLANEQAASAAINGFLAKNRNASTYLGPYPMYFTTLNYLALDRLLLLLVQHHKQDVEVLEADLAKIVEPQALELLQHLLDAKKANVEALQEMSAARKQSHAG